MDFKVKSIDDYNIVMYDNTYKMFPLKDNSIYSLKLNIISSSVSNGAVYNIDVLKYIRNNRKEREMLMIDSEVLGFSTGQVIPDGVYKFELVINETNRAENTYVVLNGINKNIKEIAEKSENAIILENSGVYYNEPDKIDSILKVNYAFSLYYALLNSLEEGKESVINNYIDKLKRLLLII